MLLEVHHGDDGVLLVNGNCRVRISFRFDSLLQSGFFVQAIHLLDYIRSRCHLPLSLTIDLCLINSGEPFRLASFDSKLLPFEQEDSPSHLQCVLTRIDGTRGDFDTKEDFLYLEQGTYIPLSNNPKLINNEFLAKLKKATNSKGSTKIFSKITKQPTTGSPKSQPVKRRRSLKSVAIAATFTTTNHH